ncbi:MAG: hypothetical protein ABDK94_04465 [Atribacterota bacterium]
MIRSMGPRVMAYFQGKGVMVLQSDAEAVSRMLLLHKEGDLPFCRYVSPFPLPLGVLPCGGDPGVVLGTL